MTDSENKKTEEELQSTYQNMEQKVESQTKELSQLNKKLIEEIRLREEADRILLLSEKKYRMLVETAGDVIYATDYKGNFVYVNDRSEALTGYKKEELFGKHFTLLIHPDWKEKVLDFYKKQFSERIPETVYSFQIITKNQEEKWVEQVTVLLQEDSLVSGFQSVVRDISDRKISERLLQEREEQLNTIIKNAPDAVIVIDEQGNVVEWNPKAEAVFGWMKNEVIGKPMHGFIMPERYVERHKKGLEHFVKTRQGPILNQTIQLEALKKDKSEINIEITISPTIIKNNYLFIAFLRDITEIKKADRMIKERERQLNIILTNAPDAVIVIDDKGLIKEWNPKAESIFGWKKEEVMDKPMHEFIMPERYIESYKKGLKKTLENKEEDGAILNKSIQFEALRKNGSEFNVEYIVSPTKMEGHELFIAFLRDITERKESEQKILELNKNLEKSVAQMEAANKELESFSYSVSHDLRAPLRGINGFTKILEEEYGKKLDEEGLRLLDIVKSSAEKMGVLIDDLLAFSRTGRQEIKKTKINMETLVKGSIAEIEKNSGTIKARINIKDLPEIEGDFNLLRQVVHNLISNSVKFSSKVEKPEIEIGSYKDGEKMIYYFKDNGVGFDMKYADKLFGVFQRLHSEQEYEGTGVGLAIVKRIVERLGGKVWAEAELNKGATFFISLPITNTPEDVADTITEEALSDHL